MPLKVFDYECNECGKIHRDMIVDPAERQKCSDCGKSMTRLFVAPRAPEREGNFRPFWSDTMQTRIKDREDLAKLRQYAKDKGLTNVGHTNMKPDKAAIRWNYEHD